MAGSRSTLAAALAASPADAQGRTAQLIEAVAESPADPWTNGDLAMALHAHGQLGAAGSLDERAEILSGGEFR